MSLLSSFIASRIVMELEQQFISHLPELQTAFVNEVSTFVKVLSEWVQTKTDVKGEPRDEEKGK